MNYRRHGNGKYPPFVLSKHSAWRETNLIFIQDFRTQSSMEPRTLCPRTSIRWHSLISISGFGSLEVACWPLVPKFAGSRPAEAVGFLGLSFGGEVKPSVPCRSFTACKRFLNVTCKSAFRQNYRTFLASSSTFHRWVLSHGDTRGDAWCRKFERLTKIAQ